MEQKISEAIRYVGADDKDIDLFEGQYKVPNGVSYNSYVILDEKIAVMDTVDCRRTKEWLENLDKELGGRTPDYLVVQHMEPDHAGSVQVLAERYPEMKLVGNAKTFTILKQFFEVEAAERSVVVKEGDSLELGAHTLHFVMAPMVHWPEVMVSYESTEKTLFAADAFGKFGALDTEEAWLPEARRYFLNIVGKYGAQVQNLLKKAATLEIERICPLHGPVLEENLGYYIGKYLTWSSYEPEEPGIVVAYASIYGHTAQAAERLAEILRAKTEKPVVVYDVARTDMAELLAEVFRYDTLVLASVSYDGGAFPCMEDFLHHLKIKTFRNRKVGLVENGSWAPSAAKSMRAALEEMKNMTICEPVVTIRSAYKEADEAAMEALSEALLA